MSDQSCCNFKVTRREDGFSVDVTGEQCKELLERLLACCSSEEGEDKKGCC